MFALRAERLNDLYRVAIVPPSIERSRVLTRGSSPAMHTRRRAGTDHLEDVAWHAFNEDIQETERVGGERAFGNERTPSCLRVEISSFLLLPLALLLPALLAF